MQIQLVSNSITLGDNQKDYINEKIENLSKYEQRVADEATLVRVDVEKRKVRSGDQKITTQITMYVPHAVIRAEVHGINVEETVDLAVDKLKKQIERYKTKKHRREKGGKLMPESTLEAVSQSGVSEEMMEQIVKRKKYKNVEPMREDEAVEQMDLLGHDFFAFVNSDTNLFSVVYRRQDGDYGLIELEKK
ncbi:ribosome-associated translation inhibitor RaiA [Candidatus Peregrinibacteria bacterium]|nr:ribosome-associated translation inhibitor RaiA [Candidatus Peregrinibacteria bacterium]